LAGYIREWPPLLDGIKHVQRVRTLALDGAWRELQSALYEGKVKSRFAGARYEIARHDGIKPHSWHRAAVIADVGGAVTFNYDGRPIVTNPAHPNYLPLHQVEICWADVLRYWPEPNPQPAPKTKIEALRSWLGARYGSAGPPPGTTAKTIAREFKADTNISVDARTVRRARGGR
jgi:hypothetical protein